MRGFKTIENYTFDECIEYINSNTDDDYNQQIKKQYENLLAQLQQEDNRKFDACKTKKDYLAYINSFPLFDGSSKYCGSHIEDAKKTIKLWIVNKIKSIIGVILFVYLAGITLGCSYVVCSSLNERYRFFIYDEHPEYARIRICNILEDFPLVNIGPHEENFRGWIGLGTTSIQNTTIRWTESDLRRIAEDINNRRKIMAFVWLIVSIVFMILINKKLIKFKYLRY